MSRRNKHLSNLTREEMAEFKKEQLDVDKMSLQELLDKCDDDSRSYKEFKKSFIQHQGARISQNVSPKKEKKQSSWFDGFFVGLVIGLIIGYVVLGSIFLK